MSGNKNSGRKAKEGAVRTSILIDAEVYNYLSRNGNLSAEVERIAREDMGTYTDSKAITINRRTKLGWAWTTGVVGNSIPKPDEPDRRHIGTVKKILESIAEDRGFASLGGTYYATAWFVRVGGEWRRICDGSPRDLSEVQSIQVTIE